MAYRVAHISDLHFGRKSFSKILKQLGASFIKNKIDHVICSGDVTDDGLEKQYAAYKNTLKEFVEGGRITSVCGNHDRLGDNIAKYIMPERVDVVETDDMYVIKVDSTAPHNKWLIYGCGIICYQVLAKVETLLETTPKNKTVIILLHHHLLPLPEETFWEKVAKKIGLPFADELDLGNKLIEVATGKVDLILYGHRHDFMSEFNFSNDRILSVYNSGCTPKWKKYRVFSMEAGKIIDTEWVEF